MDRLFIQFRDTAGERVYMHDNTTFFVKVSQQLLPELVVQLNNAWAYIFSKSSTALVITRRQQLLFTLDWSGCR